MKIDTEGTYTLRYTAEDECGNVTTEDRTVNVINITYKTVLFADGTFIINEKSTDRDANIALHGAVTNEYVPYNPNGASFVDQYNFGGNASSRPWSAQSANVLSVEIGSPISPISTAQWFRYFSNCDNFNFDGLDMSDCTATNSMFGNCTKLTEIDMSDWDMQNVTDMTEMFFYCTALGTADLSGLDLKNVTSMRGLFTACFAMTSVDLTRVTTENVTTIKNIFSGCRLVSSIDLSSFNFEKLTDISSAFASCNVATNIVLPNTFSSALTNMATMCDGCRALQNANSINLTVLDTSNVTTMESAFNDCRVLESIDISSFTTTALTNAATLFQSCTALKTIYATALFDVTNVTSTNNMFYGDTVLVGGAGTVYNSAYRHGSYARIDNPPDAPGYFTAKS